MVCKNCGADLKPGIKYCLNCGDYIEEESDNKSVSSKSDSDTNSNSVSDDDNSLINNNFDINENNGFKMDELVHKKSKFKFKFKDIIIYVVLGLVVVVSLFVMIYSLINNGKNKNITPTPSSPTVVEDKKVKIKNYTITFPGKLDYSSDDGVIYISDDKNYTFSYKNSVDDYNKYTSDLTILEKSLNKSGYNVISNEKREIDENEFLIYKFKFDSSIKYLYVTKVNKKYISMGTIEETPGGDWKEALIVIKDINKNIKFDDESDIDEIISDSISDISGLLK